ncbi:Lrp/AsnC family transcriptional regulator [Agromyces seonyuensis]|uniref:AsnC family transcriptional regulator n=1 Tax=Agromyces seonyuensis TaxID=2662446 RepID=A0A6I4NSA6_9MICO|nr:Lrp/AsnC family transcriptional regulator [Agromyces seonyuensis]MWB97316.1 AsnC family transcriptional regulator [Agromyces seonyuensis]
MTLLLDDLDRRIAAALVGNGRASWRRIATVLGEPERSVARRGARLLDEGIVRVLALPNLRGPLRVDPHALRARVRPGAMRATGEALAAREDVGRVSVLASENVVYAELFLASGEVLDFVDAGLGAIEGITGYRLDEISRYHRTASGWRPDLLTSEQYELLGNVDEHASLFATPIDLDEGTTTLFAALRQDGRATAQQLARELGVSTATVASRLEQASAAGALFIRGVVSPAVLGYPVEALLRLDPMPGELDRVAAVFAARPETRVCAVAGASVVVDLATADVAALEAAVAAAAARLPAPCPMHLDLVAAGPKRGGVRFDGDLPTHDALQMRLTT